MNEFDSLGALQLPKEKKTIAHDFRGNDLTNPHQMVWVGSEIVSEDDLKEYLDQKLGEMTTLEKLNEFTRLVDTDSEADMSAFAAVHLLLTEVLKERIEIQGITDYFELTYQSLEDSI